MSDLIKILFLAANPTGMAPLQLAHESRAIDQALRSSNLRDRFALEDHWAVRVGDLQELLLRHEPHIVHFSGHGTEENQIILLDEKSQGHPVSADALARLLGHFTQNLRCVVLNACFSETQAATIAETVDCVIGIEDEITDMDAVTFAAAFYRSLGYGKSVKSALELAQSELEILNRPLPLQAQLIALHTDASTIHLLPLLINEQAQPGTLKSVAGLVANGHSATFPERGEAAHPALQGMAGQTPRIMMIIVVLAAVGMMVLVALSLLSPS
jgi:hypothetical protein